MPACCRDRRRRAVAAARRRTRIATSDHRAGDAQFAALPGDGMIRRARSAVLRFDAGRRLAQIDLGGRVDRSDPGCRVTCAITCCLLRRAHRQSLFTGDFLLPGRLLVDDIDAYRASAQRAAEFVKAQAGERTCSARTSSSTSTGEPYPSGSHLSSRTSVRRRSTVSIVEALPAALADFNGFYSNHPNFIVVNPDPQSSSALGRGRS